MSTFAATINHPSYDVVENTTIKEYGLSATLYSHKKSGAQVISVISPQDDNKVFGITFRTPPSDSAGIPHILEHSVLCGSRKYPTKEPFVELLKGSLQNFLNAFTYPDRTCYPVATTNTKDFYNLINVYLDAVLHPRAVKDPMVLQQEGWHYELEDPSKPLSYKGVVFNEMKGVYSNPDQLYSRCVQNQLFPDNVYVLDSGGDPKVIPTLTFDRFKEFHEKYYHPSNSRVYFYGNDDPFRRLELLDEYLQEFERPTRDVQSSSIAYQKFRSDLPRKTLRFPLDDSAKPLHMIGINWLLNDRSLSLKESLTLTILDSLLLGTSSSPLRKILTESNLGESLIGGGIDDDLQQSIFSVGLKGVTAEHVNDVEELIIKTLTELSIKGFEADEIEAAINTLEFRLRENNHGGFPKGLAVMLGMLRNWNYDRDPFDGIRFEDALESIKKDVADGLPIFQTMLKERLVDNKHRVSVEAIPDKNLEKQIQEEEASTLAAVKARLSPEEINQIIADTQSLKEIQMREDSPEARATIPKLSISEIERKQFQVPIEVTKMEDWTVLQHDLETSGIVYVDVSFDFSNLSLEDLPYLPLYLRLLKEAGTSTWDEVALSRQIGIHTGGISTSMHTDARRSHSSVPPHVVTVGDGDDAILHSVMRGKAIESKIPQLFELMGDMLLNVQLNHRRRAIEILRERKARLEASVLSSGHALAATRIAARSSLLGYISEHTSGLSAIRRSSSMVEQAEQHWEEVYAVLHRIHQTLFSSKTQRILNLTAKKDLIERIHPTLKTFVSKISSASGSCEGSAAADAAASLSLSSQWKAEKSSRLLPFQNEGYSMPSQVNYVGLGGPLVLPGEAAGGHFDVLTRFLSTGYLWNTVRVVGGAYGGFARFSEVSGRFVLLSYRDPNLMTTVQAYEHIPQALEGDQISPELIQDSIIGSIGDIDSPLSPDQKGYQSWVQHLNGETAEDRQRWRDEILATTTDHASIMSSKLATLMKDRCSLAVFGSQAALLEANEAFRAQVDGGNASRTMIPLVIESALAKNTTIATSEEAEEGSLPDGEEESM